MSQTILIRPGAPTRVQIGVSGIPTVLVRVSSQGPPGPPGVSGDKFYDHDQMTASSIWTINHNLGKYPSITVVDSGGNVVEGAIQELSATQAILNFSSAFAGHAYCN